MKELEFPTQSVPKGRRFCTVCGEIKRETHFEGDSTHCDECCRKMRHTHVRFYGVLTFVLLLLIGAAAGMLCVQTVRFCAATHRAEALAADARLYNACDVYDAAIGELDGINRTLLLQNKTNEDGTQASVPTVFTAGTRTWVRYARVYARTHSDYDAASLLSSSLDKKQMAAYSSLAMYSQAQEAYDTVYNAMQQITGDTQDAASVPYDELIAALDAIEQENDTRYYHGYVALFKASATQYFKQDALSQAVKDFDRALQLLPDEYINVYSSQSQIALHLEDWALLKSVGEAMLSQNRNYTDAYSWLVFAASKQGDAAAADAAAQMLHDDDPDSPLYEKLRIQTALLSGNITVAKQVIADAKTRLDKKATEFFNTMLAKQTLDDASARFLKEYIQYATFEGITCLADDDLDGAAEAAFEHGYNYGYYMEYLLGNSALSQQTIDVAWIYASLSGNEDALSQIGDMAPGYDWAQQIVDGEITVQQAFLEGGADLL